MIIELELSFSRKSRVIFYIKPILKAKRTTNLNLKMFNVYLFVILCSIKILYYFQEKGTFLQKNLKVMVSSRKNIFMHFNAASEEVCIDLF